MTETAKIPNIHDFVPPWLEKDLEKLDDGARKQFLARYESTIQELVEKLESSPLNHGDDGTERGKLSARIPGTTKFFNLKSGLWTLVKCGGPLLLAGTIAAPLLAAVGVTLGGTVTLLTAGSAVAALYDAFASLNPVEMDIYLAVVAAIERNKTTILVNRGASVEQVVESFRRDKQLMRPDDPGAVLKQLVEKKVLTYDASTGLPEYFLAF
jgi:hypothetical protein